MKGHILPDMTNNIVCGNSIISSNYLTTRLDLQIEELRNVKPFDWFGDKGFLNKIGIKGFDCIIGNPPYIDSEEMTKTQIDTRRYCVENNFKTAKGNWDMYCVFSERGMSLLKDGGFFGYIIPNKFISAPYGEY
jgi:methylase of polypeptide subunit release factors